MDAPSHERRSQYVVHESSPEAVAEQTAVACSDYAALVSVLRHAATSESMAQALDHFFGFLTRQGFCCMTLELVSGSTVHTLPYGDMASLVSAREPDTSFSSYVFPVEHPAGGGQITYVIGRECPVDHALLEMITSQISLCVGREALARSADQAENRARQRIVEIATIYEIGEAIDHTDQSGLLDLIAHRAAKLLDARTCSLMVLDNETGTLRVEASYGLPARAKSLVVPIGQGIAGRVATTAEPMLLVGDFRTNPLGESAIGSSLLVPLKSAQGAMLGVLSVRRDRPAPEYSDDDLKLLSFFGAQAALALANAKLYEDQKRQAAELSKLSGLTRVLSTLDLDELLAHVADDICNTVDFDRCCLYMRDTARSVYVPTVMRGYPASVTRNTVKEGEGAVGHVARTRTMVCFDAGRVPQEERERSHLLLKGFARSLGTDAFIAVPIVDAHNQCLGVVVADNRIRRLPISRSQIDLLVAFVSQAGIAIENARLYGNTHRLKTYIDSVFESIAVGILAIDTNGMITRRNGAAGAILSRLGDFRPQMALPEIISNMRLPGAEREHLRSLVQRANDTEESIHMHKFMLHPRDSQALALNIILSRLVDTNRQRSGVVLIFEDVTLEVQLEAEVEKMRRLADIGQLAAKMAHEVRNALSAIKGAAQMLLVEMDGNVGSKEWPDIIVAEVDGLSRLTSELLEFARPMPLDPQPVDLSEFLYASVQSLSTFLNENDTRVHWQVALGMPEVRADPVYLGQVVRNIVMNAAQAMPDGGELYITAGYDTRGSTVTLRFRDTGVGIPPEDLERIFQPFVTTKTKGTGLGLPIVQKIVDHHGGQVSVESAVGVGTSFIVQLPLSPPREVAEAGRAVIGGPQIGPRDAPAHAT